MSTLTDPFVASFSGDVIVPLNVLKEPSCLALTFAPVHSTFESAFENAYFVEVAPGAAVATVTDWASAVVARALSFPG